MNDEAQRIIDAHIQQLNIHFGDRIKQLEEAVTSLNKVDLEQGDQLLALGTHVSQVKEQMEAFDNVRARINNLLDKEDQQYDEQEVEFLYSIKDVAKLLGVSKHMARYILTRLRFLTVIDGTLQAHHSAVSAGFVTYKNAKPRVTSEGLVVLNHFDRVKYDFQGED